MSNSPELLKDPLNNLKFNDKSNDLKSLSYVSDRFSYQRWPTREVKVGDLGIGGENPIRVQTMTISDTQNVGATVDEAEKIAAAGCELVRITAPSQRDAECLKDIRQQLFKRGCRVPICADIHFTPKAALLACEYVEKVRVNPGNFADKKVFAQREYTDKEYQEELERIEEKFSPLVLRAKELGRALRIGTNHGSLSDRIMNRYGDTPLGMVESAMEFIEICRHHSFHDIVISMKASNPKVMIEAYRLLVAHMNQKKYNYPLHLGVTEAGAGEDGRIKSAVGIGSLLEDGLGDTVRVSLTEDAIHEVPVVFDLIRRFTPHHQDPVVLQRNQEVISLAGPLPETRKFQEIRKEASINPYVYQKCLTESLCVSEFALGGENPPRVQMALRQLNARGNLKEIKELLGLSETFDPSSDTLDDQQLKNLLRAEILEIPIRDLENASKGLSEIRTFLGQMKKIGLKTELALRIPQMDKKYLSLSQNDWFIVPIPGDEIKSLNTEESWLKACNDFIGGAKKQNASLQWIAIEGQLPTWAQEKWAHEKFKTSPEAYANLLLLLIKISLEQGMKNLLSSFELQNPIASYRYLAHLFAEENIKLPILLREANPCPLTPHDLRTSSVIGPLLCDGIGDAIAIDARNRSPKGRIQFAYNLLQATGNRITKTEFISCPSCGRTLFDLQETTERIRSKTGHLKGVRLAIMGCIVNGPGEMADAHFGYVGAGPGRINLYVGKELVQKNIPSQEADQRLIDLIRDHGMWMDPPAVSA